MKGESTALFLIFKNARIRGKVYEAVVDLLIVSKDMLHARSKAIGVEGEVEA